MVTKPTAPTPPPKALRSNPDTFSANAEGTINYLWDTFPDYVDDALDYVEERSNALLTANLPDLTGQGGKLVRVNAAGDATELLAPPAGDLVGTTATQELTNKEIRDGVFLATVTGSARATQGEAEAGTANDKIMTPVRVKDAYDFFEAANYFESAEIAITQNSILSAAHGFGSVPRQVWAVLRCKTAELGYAIGDEVSNIRYYDNVAPGPVSVGASATDVFVMTGESVYLFTIVVKSAGSNADFKQITFANWRIVLRARK